MPAEINDQLVRRVAHLARLALSDEEVVHVAGQLRDIVGYVEALADVDTEGVKAMAHPLAARNVFRDDVPAASLPPEQVLANAPRSAAGYFQIPKVLDQETA